MKYYAVFDSMTTDMVVQVLPEFDPIFPDIPLEDRYSAEFLKCKMEITEAQATEVTGGMFYDEELGFYMPEPPEPVEPVEPQELE